MRVSKGEAGRPSFETHRFAALLRMRFPADETAMRKPLMVLAIVACLALSVVGSLLPILQGWIFFVIALYLLATEFETGRAWVKAARRRWPFLNRWIVRARHHKWAPRHLHEFEELTDPRR